MKMTHRKAQTWLAEYVADELIAAERQALADHLEQCQVCQKDLAEIQHIHSMMRSFASPAISEINESVVHVSDRIPALPDRRHHSNSRTTQRRERYNRKFVSTLAAVLLSLLLVLSTAFVIKLEVGGNSGPAMQPHSTPTVQPYSTPTALPTQCPTSPPVSPSPATPTPTPTAIPPLRTPAPESCPTPITNPTPIP